MINKIPVVKLKDLVEIKYGDGLKNELRDEEFPYPVYGANGIVGRYNKYIVDHESVVIGRKGSCGEITLANPKFWPIDTTFYTKILDKSKIKNLYLYYFLKSLNLKRLIISTAIPGINRDSLYNINVPLPPISTQDNIVAVLLKIKTALENRHKANALTDQFLKSTFLDMFGDPIKNPKKFFKSKLSNLCRIRRGASPRPIKNFLGGTIPWIKIGDGTKGNDIFIEETSEKIIKEGVNKSVFLKAGSLIFANCGVSLGFARILKIDGCIHDGWLSLENINSNLNKLYLLKLINIITIYLRKIAPDGTQPNLNTDIMKNLDIPVPPIDLQQEFGNLVQKVEKLKEKQKKSEEDLQNLFNSLMQKAFKGELV